MTPLLPLLLIYNKQFIEKSQWNINTYNYASDLYFNSMQLVVKSYIAYLDAFEYFANGLLSPSSSKSSGTGTNPLYTNSWQSDIKLPIMCLKKKLYKIYAAK